MKNMRLSFKTFALIISLLIFNAHNAFAWNDETNLAIAKASGYKKWYNAAGDERTSLLTAVLKHLGKVKDKK